MNLDSRNPYAPPESVVEKASGDAQGAGPPSRGLLLTALLVVLTFANATMTVFYFLSAVGWITLQVRGAWAAPVLFVLMAFNVVFLVAIWRWRRWGIVALANSAMLLCCVNLARGERLQNAALGILGLVLLVVVASFKWKQFK